jgi:rhodanese-related sulfurtransferase
MEFIMSTLRAIALVFSVLSFTPVAMAQTGETPPTLEGALTVSAAETKALIDAGAQVYDARRKAAFAEGHLPKAKSISGFQNEQTKQFDAAAFGTNKQAAIIIHGHGSDGWSAVQAVKDAVAAGFGKVHWLRGGFAEWTAAKLPLEQ